MSEEVPFRLLLLFVFLVRIATDFIKDTVQALGFDVFDGGFVNLLFEGFLLNFALDFGDAADLACRELGFVQ